MKRSRPASANIASGGWFCLLGTALVVALLGHRGSQKGSLQQNRFTRLGSPKFLSQAECREHFRYTHETPLRLWASKDRAIMARTVFCWLLIGVLIASASAQIYRNVVNKPFAAVSNGPQNLVVVDIDRAGRSAEAIERLIRQRVEQVARAQIQGARPLIRLYKRYGFLPEDYRFPLIYAVALRRNGQLILPTRSRDGGLGNG
ncbi:MAG: hypothetical protein QXQ53_09265, partial [Candidatus Methanosuratincola sp.]